MNYLRKAYALVLVLIALSAFGGNIAVGQIENHLILKKGGLTNRLHFLTGDPIRFIRKGNSYEEGGVIQGIGTDYIIVAGREVSLRDIGIVVYRRTSFNYDAGGKMLMIASPFYLLLGAVNALLQDIRPIWSWGNVGVAASFAAAGVGLRTLQVRKFRLGGRYQLRIVQSDPLLNKYIAN